MIKMSISIFNKGKEKQEDPDKNRETLVIKENKVKRNNKSDIRYTIVTFITRIIKI